MANASATALPGTVLGFDFGLVRLGVAVGQALTGTAQPLATLKVRSQRQNWDAISQIIADWRPDALVVGVPYHTDGGSNSVTAAALRFSRQLHGRYRLPVEIIDERLSSHGAKHFPTLVPSARKRRNRGTVDAFAAALILESWFAQQRKAVRAEP